MVGIYILHGLHDVARWLRYMSRTPQIRLFFKSLVNAGTKERLKGRSPWFGSPTEVTVMPSMSMT